MVISDDLEGQNEASVELLVLGKLILICQHVLAAKNNNSDNNKTTFTFFFYLAVGLQFVTCSS